MVFIELLKDCGKKKDLCKGIRIHEEILKRGLLQQCPHIGNTLISMYAKCGALSKARNVLNELPNRNIISWNALISGYTQQKQGIEAIRCFKIMRNDGLSPNEVTYICILKACGNIGAIEEGRRIHEEVVSKGLVCKHIMLGSALVDMYAKCGFLVKAQQVLEELPIRNVVSWSSLIAGYVQHGLGNDAIDCFQRMQNEGLSPDAITFTCILKACGSTRAVEKGREIHDEISSRGFLHDDVVIGNALVDMYAKCGLVKKAQQVLSELYVRDVVSWNTLIGGYAHEGKFNEAMDCFQRMQNEGFSPNSITFISILKACVSNRAIEKGILMHGEIINRGFLYKDVLLGNALVDMYAKCGLLQKAEQVLDGLIECDIVSWNALLTGYVEQGEGEGALNCFQRMQSKGFSPDEITFLCLLKACGDKREVEQGQQIHEELKSRGLLHKNLMLGTALVEMYAKCGMLAAAKEILYNLPVRDVVSWSALIIGCVQQGHGDEAIEYYERMLSEGFSPDAITFACILQACGSVNAIEKGKQIHDEIVNRNLLGNDIVLANALVDMYVKCGILPKAQEVFDGLLIRNVVTWNALISGYAQEGHSQETFKCFQKMKREGVSPDAVTYICILKACGGSGAIEKGEQIHDEIVDRGLLRENVVLTTALVDLYAKCGALEKAQEVLESLVSQDVVSWNALISGYAQWGKGIDAVKCFQKMESKGTRPDAITFLSLLNACSRSGLFEEAQSYFEDMSKKYDIKPTIEHRSCMVDVFGHMGYLDKAMCEIEKMLPSDSCTVAWRTLLDACRKWGNVDIGKLAFDQVVKLDSCDASAYVLMANIYAAANMNEESQKVETMRLKKCHESDDMNENVHSFCVEDSNHTKKRDP